MNMDIFGLAENERCCWDAHGIKIMREASYDTVRQCFDYGFDVG